jgi:hypothetical protein
MILKVQRFRVQSSGLEVRNPGTPVLPGIFFEPMKGYR